jgi:hypothetical protein
MTSLGEGGGRHWQAIGGLWEGQRCELPVVAVERAGADKADAQTHFDQFRVQKLGD